MELNDKFLFLRTENMFALRTEEGLPCPDWWIIPDSEIIILRTKYLACLQQAPDDPDIDIEV